MHDVGLERETIVNMCDIANVDHAAVHYFNGQIVEFRGLNRATVECHVIFFRPQFDGPLRKNQILRAHCIDDVSPGHAP